MFFVNLKGRNWRCVPPIFGSFSKNITSHNYVLFNDTMQQQQQHLHNSEYVDSTSKGRLESVGKV